MRHIIYHKNLSLVIILHQKITKMLGELRPELHIKKLLLIKGISFGFTH